MTELTSAENGVVRARDIPYPLQTYTTGAVAIICKVAPRTVTKWFDSGRLRGYRLPGSLDRRIPRASLIAFLTEHGMPLGELGLQEDRLLCVGLSASLPAELAGLLGDGWTVRTAEDAWEAATLCAELHPTAVLLGDGLGAGLCRTITRAVLGKNPQAVIVALRPDDCVAGWLAVPGVVEVPASAVTVEALAGLLARGE